MDCRRDLPAESPGGIRGPAYRHTRNTVITELGDGFDLRVKALLRIVIGSGHRIAGIFNRKGRHRAPKPYKGLVD